MSSNGLFGRLVPAGAVACAMLSLASAPIRAQDRGTARTMPAVIAPKELAGLLEDPNLVLLHISEKPEYDAEHLPGARFLDIRTIVLDKSSDGKDLEMLPIEELRPKFEALGVSDDSRIVVYYGNNWLTFVTRTILTLHHIGLGTQVSFLDGGLPEWKRDSLPLTTVAPPPKTGRLSARPLVPAIVTADFVRDHIRKPGFSIIDARAPIFYSGAPRGDQKPGHIPGAVNIPFNTVYVTGGHFRSPKELRAMFDAAGIAPGDTIIAYCHIGQQATAVVFAARLLGHEVRLYDGSFTEWQAKSLPIEGGEAK